MAMRAALASGGVDGRVDVSDASGAPSAAADYLDVYLRVMAKAGVYAERLEIEALAGLVGAPIHIYYYAGESDAAEAPPPAPSEVVVPLEVCLRMDAWVSRPPRGFQSGSLTLRRREPRTRGRS